MPARLINLVAFKSQAIGLSNYRDTKCLCEQCEKRVRPAAQKPTGAKISFDGEWLCGCSKSGQSHIVHSGIVPICPNPE